MRNEDEWGREIKGESVRENINFSYVSSCHSGSFLQYNYDFIINIVFPAFWVPGNETNGA